MSKKNDGLTKTCLRIDHDTWTKFRVHCIKEGCSANDKLTRLVEAHIKKVEELNDGRN